MRFIADWIMQRRAQRLLMRLRPYLLHAETIVDLGSGTGHNAQAIRAATSAQVLEFDVADIHWVGPAPLMIVADQVPLPNDSASLVLMLHVLHYCDKPAKLLAEAARLSNANVIVLQTTCDGLWAMNVLRVQEFFYGRFAFYLARLAGLVSSDSCPLYPRAYFDRTSLQSVFATAGLSIARHSSHSPACWPLNGDLYLLQKNSDVDADKRSHESH
jgi:SAM-dependent methyltransferase